MVHRLLGLVLVYSGEQLAEFHLLAHPLVAQRWCRAPQGDEAARSRLVISALPRGTSLHRTSHGLTPTPVFVPGSKSCSRAQGTFITHKLCRFASTLQTFTG